MSNYFIADYHAGNILSSLFNGTAIAWPNPMYIGLLEAVPSPGDSSTVGGIGELVQEPTRDPEYLRGQINQGTANWSKPNNRVSYNLASIIFPTPTVQWGPILWLGFFTAQVAGQNPQGNFLYALKLRRSVVIPGGTPTPTIYPKTIFVTIRGG